MVVGTAAGEFGVAAAAVAVVGAADGGEVGAADGGGGAAAPHISQEAAVASFWKVHARHDQGRGAAVVGADPDAIRTCKKKITTIKKQKKCSLYRSFIFFKKKKKGRRG